MNLSSIPIDMIAMNVVIYRYEGGDFVFVDVNKEVEKTEQINRADLIGKRLTEAFPGVKEFGLFDVLLRVYETGKEEVFETAFYEDERISGWRRNTIYKLPDGTVAALYEDKTGTKQLEAELLSLGTIVDSSINEIYIFNIDDLHFTYVNSGAQQNTGYSLEEMRQMTPLDIKPTMTHEAFHQMIRPPCRGERDIENLRNGTPP
jgi:PAS domain-containing protein